MTSLFNILTTYALNPRLLEERGIDGLRRGSRARVLSPRPTALPQPSIRELLPGREENLSVTSLFNILTTYTLNHPSVSYCQVRREPQCDQPLQHPYHLRPQPSICELLPVREENLSVTSFFNILTTYALNHPSVSYCQVRRETIM